MRGGPPGQFGVDTREHLFSWLTPSHPAVREDGVEGQGVAGAGGWSGRRACPGAASREVLALGAGERPTGGEF